MNKENTTNEKVNDQSNGKDSLETYEEIKRNKETGSSLAVDKNKDTESIPNNKNKTAPTNMSTDSVKESNEQKSDSSTTSESSECSSASGEGVEPGIKQNEGAADVHSNDSESNTSENEEDSGTIEEIESSNENAEETVQRTLFVRNLPFDLTEDDLMKKMKEIGRVVKVKIICQSSSGRSKGYGFVEFLKLVDAKKCIELSGTEMFGRTISIFTSNSDGNTRKFRLKVTNLPFVIEKDDFIEFLTENIGKPHQVVIPYDKEFNRHKGFAYVSFDDKETHDQAIKSKLKYKERSIFFKDADQVDQKRGSGSFNIRRKREDTEDTDDKDFKKRRYNKEENSDYKSRDDRRQKKDFGRKRTFDDDKGERARGDRHSSKGGNKFNDSEKFEKKNRGEKKYNQSKSDTKPKKIVFDSDDED